MSDENVFAGFNEEKQKEYEKEAQAMWGDAVTQSMKLWNSYSEERKAEIMQEGSDIYTAVAAKMDLSPQHPDIQALLERWHEHIRYFYEPSLETLRGLGEAYHDHPDFNATFTAIDPALPAFLKRAITHYVEALETAWLERELALEA